MEQLVTYLMGKVERHKQERRNLITGGKSYRSRYVAYQNGYISALLEIIDTLELPKRNAKLTEAMRNWEESLRG